jgi:hypothetical protein
MMDGCQLSIQGGHEPTNYEHEHPSIQYVHTIVHFVYGISFRIDECHPKVGTTINAWY